MFKNRRLCQTATEVTVHKAGVTKTYLRSYVTGSNDAILNEVGRTMAVSLVGEHHGLGGASGGQLWDSSSLSCWAMLV
jgi:hypothetical protein